MPPLSLKTIPFWQADAMLLQPPTIQRLMPKSPVSEMLVKSCRRLIFRVVIYTPHASLARCVWVRLKQVFYAATRHDAAEAGFNDAFIYEELSRKQENRTILFEQCLRQNALEVFSAWKTHPYKTHY